MIVMPDRDIADNGALVVERIKAIRALVRTGLFKDKLCRRIIVPKVVSELKKYVDSGVDRVEPITRRLSRKETIMERSDNHHPLQQPQATPRDGLNQLCNQVLGQLLGKTTS